MSIDNVPQSRSPEIHTPANSAFRKRVAILSYHHGKILHIMLQSIQKQVPRYNLRQSCQNPSTVNTNHHERTKMTVFLNTLQTVEPDIFQRSKVTRKRPSGILLK